MRNIFTILLIWLFAIQVSSQEIDPYQADTSTPRTIEGMKLVWNDEFDGATLNTTHWTYETGFVRNEELQYYQAANVKLNNGLLVMTGKRDTVPNSKYNAASTDWRYSRAYGYYTSGSIKSQNKKSFLFGKFEIRARIDTTKGSWPAIWTKGNVGSWPTCGEIDILEFYISGGKQVFLANVIYGGSPETVKYMGAKKDLSYFIAKDPDFVKKFHVWTEEWDEKFIKLYLDGELIYGRSVSSSANPEGSTVPNGFLQPHYFTLNLAVGANGGDPVKSTFPIQYEVDYVRVYQPVGTAIDSQYDESIFYFSQKDNNLRIQTNEATDKLIITDLMGRIVFDVESPEKSVCLAHLKPGVYIAKLDMKNGNSIVQKFNKSNF